VGLSLVQLSFVHALIVKTEVEKLYATVMYMQQCAQVSNQDQIMTFDHAHNKYAYDNHRQQLPTQVQFGCVPGAKGPPSSPNKLITSAITFKNHCITLHPNGIIQPGTLYLVDSGKQYMYALSCGIANVSHLRLYRY